jgi:hypothetical protein
MPRVVEFTVPPERTEAVLARLQEVGPLSVRVFRGVSVQPPGDLITAEVRNADMAGFLRMADAAGLGGSGSSLTVSRPQAVISSSDPRRSTRDTSTTSFEEMLDLIGRESTMTPLKLLVMFGGGLIAALGIYLGALHLIIGALIVVPAYEPIARLVLGLVVARREPILSGLQDTALAYAGIIAGAFSAGLLVQLFAQDPLGGPNAYVSTSTLLSFWSSLEWTSVVLSLTAGILGGLLILLARTVLTAGVVIVLALVPSSTIVGLALSAPDVDLAVSALGRWAVDVGLVIAGCALVFGVKRAVDGRGLAGGGRPGSRHPEEAPR